MTMFNPPHPGSILKEDFLPELGIGVTEAAIQLGVSRVALSRVINGRAAISADMALRLEAWMNDSSAETWVRMQAEYDLWQARQKPRPTITPISIPHAA
jgi:addiction module HigA family antidote